MPFTALAVVGVGVIAVALLTGWHILGNFRTPPGPGEGGGPRP